MIKEAAMHQFWSSFSIPAYEESTAPDGAALPYITYNLSTASGIDDNSVYMSGNIWYKSMSWTDITAKANQISEHLKNGGVIKVDNGYLWIRKGTPFAIRMEEPSDETIRRININIEVDYITAY